MWRLNRKNARALAALICFIGLAVHTVGAQPVLRKQIDPSEVVEVRTFPGRTTVIELPEPPDMVVACDSAAFKIEAVGNKIFIQPLDQNAATNLFVWTAAGRLNFNLVTSCDENNFNHVVDYSPPPLSKDESERRQKELELLRDQIISEQKEKIIHSLLSPPRTAPRSEKIQKQPILYFQGAIQIDDIMYIRYVLVNTTGRRFTVRDPQIALAVLASPQQADGLPPHGAPQGDARLRKLRVYQTSPPTLMAHRLQKAELLPGEQTSGVLAITFSSRPPGPMLFSATFPIFDQAPAGASVVID